MLPMGIPAACATHLPSGLTAIDCEEAHRIFFSPPGTNCQDQALPIFGGADFASLKSKENAGNPFSCVKLAASFQVSVFQTLTVFPGNRSPGFAASHLPSALKTARLTAASVNVVISVLFETSQTRNSPEVA